jgi:cellulose synthase/poly-beta-1,6-N-acetylglucosamine synthase-like glycosyltransferase/beta-mannanase
MMICIGIVSMGVFLYYLLQPLQIGYAPFYWLLIAATVFNCLRVLHEWYHYFYITVPPALPLVKHFTVDIFTTFCAGEPYPMIVETLEAIQAIRYPHTTYLCDEADDPYLKEVCKRLGVHHVTRTVKKDAKAGNINNALRQSDGELCVVLDPDHVPLPEFLDPIIPYFTDDRIGFVQVVQAYSNQDASLIARGAAQQTFQFYGPMMMTMNRYGTVLAIGANCTFRRAALESIGGHAAGLSEDMHTAMQLHAKGWQSVYVPAVLTYGLVPSTLSAYYKQQLKWARGTFELLVTTYPKLFKHFSWRQRLHYGTIPFHYFSGVIFLINFLIPILSLIMGLIPLRVDLLSFALAGLPFISATLAIRHFVQHWVMGEDERGNHIVGGLLLIGTWWIYILGLIYTVIRKKIPYIPTPKDDSGPDNWSLNIPNGIIALASLFAIVYGLYTDWNPYAWVMAGIAGINFLIMLFNIIISRKPHLQRFKARSATVGTMLDYAVELKLKFWHFRHALYTGVRKFALALLVCTFTLTVLFMAAASKQPTRTGKRIFKHDIFYAGIFSPAGSGGLSSMQQVQKEQDRYNCHFNIISLYIPWGDAAECFIPGALADSIYRNGSYPMITWEPWGALFKDKALNNEQQLLARISSGAYDLYLAAFADQLRALNRPVYLRFAHEADNPAYPWSASGGNTPEDFRKAWRYVHRLFQQRGVYNAVWVWNPWKAENVAAYFPGREYVDWLGVTGLNYGSLNEDGRSYSFEELYMPYHQLPLFHADLPVMIAETGSLRGEGDQDAWLNSALSVMEKDFKEIKALVLFNSPADRNVPPAARNETLNWQVDTPGLFFTAMAWYHARKWHGLSAMYRPMPALAAYTGRPASRHWFTDTIRGVNYEKGRHWYRNMHALTRRTIEQDFIAMKQLGINTIKRSGPGVYDRNILAAASRLQLKVHYSFGAPDIADIISEEPKLEKLADNIEATVRKLKKDSSIIAWNIADTLWQQLSDRFYKPTLVYQQAAYIAWLRSVIARIRAIDPVRPVTMDLKVNTGLESLIQRLQQELPEIDAFGLIIPEDGAGLSQISSLQAPWFISQAPVSQYAGTGLKTGSVFLKNWQDIGDRDYLTFDGILDHWGRHKPAWQQVERLWAHHNAGDSALPPVKILRPAALTLKDSRLTYHAIIEQGEQWSLAAASAPQGVQFEWYLLRTDEWGNPMMLTPAGKGPSLELAIPEDPAHYRLYLVAARGKTVVTAQSPLNIPLLYKQGRQL